MEITSDIMLKGAEWTNAIDKLSSIFTLRHRRNYNIFMLCLAIGIMYDVRKDELSESVDTTPSVPRNVLQNNDNGKLDFMFQAAILSTKTENYSEEERLDLAFGEKNEFNKIAFLVQFANFGVTKINELLGNTPLETMENIKNFLSSTIEGRNLEIDALPDDLLLEI